MKLTNRKMTPGDWNNLAVNFNRMAADTDARRENQRIAQERQEYSDAGAMRLAQRNSPAAVEGHSVPEGATPVGGLPWINGHVPSSMTEAKAWDDADTFHARARSRADVEESRRFGDAFLRQLAESPDPGSEFSRALPKITNLNQMLAAVNVMNELTTATNAGAELRKSKRAAIDVQFAAVKEVSDAAVNAEQRGDRVTAARLLEQLSEKLNIPYKYVHNGQGMMEVQTMDANTNEYVTAAGAAGLVPVDEAIESLRNLTREEFAFETEKNEISIKKLNETDLKPVWNGGKEYILHTWRNPINLNDVAYFVYDPVTKERIGEYESHYDLTTKGGFKPEEHATSSAKVAKAQGDVRLTEARIRSEGELAAKRRREAGEIGRTGSIPIAEQRQSAAQAVRIVGGLTGRPGLKLEDGGDPASKLGDLYALIEDPSASREVKQAAGDAIRIIETWLENVQEGMGISRNPKTPGEYYGLPSFSGGSNVRMGLDGSPRTTNSAQGDDAWRAWAPAQGNAPGSQPSAQTKRPAQGPTPAQRQVVRTGTEPGTGRRVVQYDDGSTEYAD